ncbi:uncharacterized protein METZ01_LOCUS424850, partial [marine metagenome]
MKKNLSLLSFVLLFSLITWSLINEKPDILGRLPVPTEFDINKSKRKDFKNQRKEYMHMMHRSHPDDNWEMMNMKTRNLKTDAVRQLRETLMNSKVWNPNNKYMENISRDLSGYWQERGSNNLAGRILTADIDWGNNFIYCASD